MNSIFESNIQQWVSIDNQLKILNEKIKELRDKKNALTENIINYANVKGDTTPMIKISDGKLKFTNTKIAEPITFKYLEKTLSGVIKNESQIKIIMEHIKQKREVKTITEIKRIMN